MATNTGASREGAHFSLTAVATPFVRLFQRWMPDPFIFAVLLSLVTFLLAMLVAGATPGAAVFAWGKNFWNLLAFTTQIAMTLVTGHALAQTPLVRRILDGFANLAASPATAYVIVAFAAGVGSLLSWGLGLVVGAIIARQTATVCLRKNITIHYPLMVAAAYSGFVIWHQGLSSSTGLLIATKGHFLEQQIGIIPVSETIFSYWNVTIALAVLFTMPVVMMLLRPRPEDCVPLPRDLIEEDAEGASAEARERTPATVLENARVLNLLVGLGGLAYLGYHFYGGGSLDLNVVNFTFLILGILLARSPVHYVQLVTDAGRVLGPIILQYPFYAGIMGIMLDTGLAKIVAGWFVAVSTAETLPVWSLISGGIINVFIPSGGGQWAVQGPIMTDAARQLGADIPRVAMGVAMGDQWTNMIQPFWTIPALAIAGLHVRDVMGYCVIALIWSGLIFALGLLYL